MRKPKNIITFRIKLRSAWKGLDQAHLHLTLSRHIIFGFAKRLCAARESNVNELDPILPGRAMRGKAALESWGQNQRLCGARESNVNELDPILSG